MNIYHQVIKLTNGYSRTGGSHNRAQQRKRMLAFAKFVTRKGRNSLGEVGDPQVNNYWRNNRSLADSTLYNHWRALCELWQLSGKLGGPPEPWYKTEKYREMSTRRSLRS